LGKNTQNTTKYYIDMWHASFGSTLFWRSFVLFSILNFAINQKKKEQWAPCNKWGLILSLLLAFQKKKMLDLQSPLLHMYFVQSLFFSFHVKFSHENYIFWIWHQLMKWGLPSLVSTPMGKFEVWAYSMFYCNLNLGLITMVCWFSNFRMTW